MMNIYQTLWLCDTIFTCRHLVYVSILMTFFVHYLPSTLPLIRSFRMSSSFVYMTIKLWPFIYYHYFIYVMSAIDLFHIAVLISKLRVMYVLFCLRECMNMRTNVSRMQKVVNR